MTNCFRAGGCAGSNYPFLTSKERDVETGLDYFLARYYSATQGRFTSGDPENWGADQQDPQSWNAYGYARSSPLVYSDPDGREYLVCDADGSNCRKVSDQDFYDERRAFEKTGNVYTGNRDFYESGEIKNAEGGVVATYVQISIDDPVRQFIFATRNAVDPIPQATLDFSKLSLEMGLPSGVIRYAVGGAGTVTTLGLRGSTAARALPQFSHSTIEQGVNYVMSNPAKVSHIFAKAQHNLQPVVSRLGGQENTVRAVLNALNGQLPSVGKFERVVNIGGQSMVVRGSVVNGIPKIGTMFVK